MTKRTVDACVYESEQLAQSCAAILKGHSGWVQAAAMAELHSIWLAVLPPVERFAALQAHAAVVLNLAELIDQVAANEPKQTQAELW